MGLIHRRTLRKLLNESEMLERRNRCEARRKKDCTVIRIAENIEHSSQERK